MSWSACWVASARGARPEGTSRVIDPSGGLLTDAVAT
jgi:hypothetical protein